MSVFHEMFLVLLWIGAIICIAVIYPQGERGFKIAWATGDCLALDPYERNQLAEINGEEK